MNTPTPLVLVAARPLKYLGRDYKRSEAIEPVPTGRLRLQLVEQRLAHEVTPEEALSTPSAPSPARPAEEGTVAAPSLPGPPSALSCSDCPDREPFSSPQGLRLHRTRVHPS